MFDSHRGENNFFFTSCGSLILYWGFRSVGLSWASHSTLIYTSELNLCSTTYFHKSRIKSSGTKVNCQNLGSLHRKKQKLNRCACLKVKSCFMKEQKLLG